MAQKREYRYTVAVTTVGGTTFTAADGQGVKHGTVAFQNLIHHETVLVTTVDGAVATENYIPFDSIDHASVTRVVALVDYEDANCAVSAEENPGG